MFYLPTSCLIFFFLFSLFHPFPCASSQQELGLCETLFECGNITAGFPFWGGNREKICGHPLLELQCNKNKSTSLFFRGQDYNVLHVDQTSNSLTLAKPDILDSLCSDRFTYSTLTAEFFEISSSYKSVKLYRCEPVLSDRSSYTCPDTFSISVSENPETCLTTAYVPSSFVTKGKELNITKLKSVLRQGFEVKVKIDEKSCQECLSSREFCGFDEDWSLGVKCSPVLPPAEEYHILCSDFFSCGNQSNLLYPFWIPGREECGHPDFKLNCSSEFAVLNIASVKFRILEVNDVSRIIRLARSDYVSDLCPQDPLNALFDENVSRFTANTELLTIYYNCSRNFSEYTSTFVGDFGCEDRRNYYVTRDLPSLILEGNSALLNDFAGLCSRSVTIPSSRSALSTLERTPSADNLKKAFEEGFELDVNFDCRMCMDSGGACGYNKTLTSSGFVCYCSNGPENHTCRLTHKFGISSKAKIGSGVALLLLFMALTSLITILRQRKTRHDLGQQNHKALISLKKYSYAQVKRITKSFAEEVGRGGFGTVYRGTLCDGRMVAVKVLKDSKGNNGEEFINEVASMSQTSHVNIVTLLGFCSEGSKRAIIYEFMENGSLDKLISSQMSSNMDRKELYEIALGVARGLEYLHYGCRTRIVHFDIKPQNVLLDDNLCPKVSDFGLAKLCEKKESILSLLDTRGTIGYIAPELFSRMYGRVSHKSDVYSYGMLVLEMIGARNQERAEQNSASNASSMYFPEWIYKDLEKGDARRLIENGISSEEDDRAKQMTLVGLWCIQPSPSDRPAMNRVVEMMEGNLDALEVPPRPVFQIPTVPLQESSTFSEDSVYTDH